ncbi:MAG TPA: SdrD B-like domain-containing protein [bacterium]|nr:SdrD B-like domain-containing protein [bacterium]HPG47330.1 SdrD B-like domain-containing protein [bacterium]HPM99659.1 SdrD B-like domain-containing protein [bacterium]
MARNRMIDYNRVGLQLVIGALLLFSLAIPGSAVQITFPLYEHIFFQASGPQAPVDNGDWWTNADYGNQPHEFQMEIPASADPEFTVTVQVYDPECFDTNGDLDEMDKPKINGNGRWDETYFQVLAPDGVTLVSDITFPPDASTSETWQTIAQFQISEYGPGIYKIFASTEQDDENGYKLRIVDNDPDGQPHNGDEISLFAYKTTLQSNGEGAVILWFYVAPDEEVLNIWNFDMDGPESILQYDITDPNGVTVAGTLSGEAEWNTGSIDFPTSGGDEFIDPVAGWWRQNIFLGDLNQIIIYGKPFFDNWYALPHLTLSKDDGVEQVRAGETHSYNLRLTNTGNGISYNTRVSDVLPAGIDFVAADNGGVYDELTRTVTWELGMLESGAVMDLLLTYLVTAGPDQTIENIARAYYEDELGLYFPLELGTDVNVTPKEPATVGDRVWLDDNGNGLQDDGEFDLANVQVNLLDGEAVVLQSQTTGGDGSYLFTDLEPGTYQLEFLLPMDHFFTAQDQGDDDALDSDADIETGLTALFELNWGDHPMIWDAGVQKKKVSDLKIEKSVSAVNVKFDEIFTYTIRVWNAGPDPAYNVQVIDDFPPDLQFIGAEPAPDAGPNPIVWVLPVLEPEGEPVEILLTARAADVSGGMDNNAFVSSENRDPNLENNSAAAQVHVLVPIELSSFSASWENNAVCLRWATQSETENVGFHIYRSESAEGDFLRITESLIAGAGNSQSVHTYSFVDNQELAAGKTYFYKLADIAYNGEITFSQAISLQTSQPDNYLLEQNYPNPFNLETRIKFILKEAGFAELSIFNTNGQRVRSLIASNLEAGSHTIAWDGRDAEGNVVPTGTYLYSLRINNFEKMQKMILLK